MPPGFEQHDPHTLSRARFELRSLHDYYAESLPGEEVIVLHDYLLGDLSALTGLMIRELDLLSRPASDSVERLSLHLRLWAGVTGWKLFIRGLAFLGLSGLAQKAFDSAKTMSGERFRSTQPVAGEHTGVRMLLNDELASHFYTALAQSILALRRPRDQRRNLFPAPVVPLAGAA